MLGLIKESKRAIAKAILCVFSIGLIAASLRANSLPDGFINSRSCKTPICNFAGVA